MQRNLRYSDGEIAHVIEADVNPFDVDYVNDINPGDDYCALYLMDGETVVHAKILSQEPCTDGPGMLEY